MPHLSGTDILFVGETHKSSVFFEFLKSLDEKSPKGDKIRFILDNQLAYILKEIQNVFNLLLHCPISNELILGRDFLAKCPDKCW